MRALWICLTVAIAFGGWPARAAELDHLSKEKLEGIWLIGQKPDRGPCVSARYSGTQIEFDFRKTGGRMVYFEPDDLFGAATIESAERNGDDLTLRFLPPLDGAAVEWGVRLANDEMKVEVRDPNPNAKGGGRFIAYRCGEPDRAVNANVPREMLEVLTPLHVRPGKFAEPHFIEMASGLSDEAQCKRAVWGPNEPPFLHFEVFGPVHYFVVGRGFHTRFDLAPIRAVTALDAHRLKVEFVERRAGGDPWGPGVRGGSETMTIELDGPRIRIPELGASFIRCDPRTLAVVR